MNRRGFFGRALGGLVGAMFPSLFLKPLPGPPTGWRYDILYGSTTIRPEYAFRLLDVGDTISFKDKHDWGH